MIVLQQQMETFWGWFADLARVLAVFDLDGSLQVHCRAVIDQNVCYDHETQEDLNWMNRLNISLRLVSFIVSFRCLQLLKNFKESFIQGTRFCD